MSVQSEDDAALAVATAFNDAWMARDLDTMRALTSDDFIQWHSHIRKDFSKAEEFAMLEEALKVMTIIFHSVRRFAFTGGVAVQCLGDIELSNGGRAKDVPFAIIYWIRDGKIYRCDEYVDGLSLPPMDFIPAR